jgi:hypothetical protein
MTVIMVNDIMLNVIVLNVIMRCGVLSRVRVSAKLHFQKALQSWHVKSLPLNDLICQLWLIFQL